MKVYLIGIGMGGSGTYTEKAKEIIKKCDVVVGAARMTEEIKNKKVFTSYKADEIRDFLLSENYKNAAVLLSGDVGFYSGAKKIIDVLKDFETEMVCGISTPVYFASKLKISWEDMKLLSIHGRNCNIIGYVKRYKKVFALLGGNDDLKALCNKLIFYGMGDVTIHIGERLSYNDERIVTAAPNKLKYDFGSLLCVVIENGNAENRSFCSINDDEFIRGNVPMTKSEARSLSISKLCISENSIIYDIGAGTGSVSVEMALKAIDGIVFAIEKNEDAIDLIGENKRKFAVDNIEIVKGSAPDVFKELPVPTHAFIGGSGGNMKNIITSLFKINKDIKIVVNAVSLNTIGEVTKIIEELKIQCDITCINIAKSKKSGKYQIMTGSNPVYIFSMG